MENQEEIIELTSPLYPDPLPISHKIMIMKILIKGGELEVLSKRFVMREIKNILDKI